MTDKIRSQILEIRDSGVINMFDVNGVQRIAFDNEMYELVCYIQEDKNRYFNFILTGEEVE